MNDKELVSNFVKNITTYPVSPATLQRDALKTIKQVLNNEFGLISAENPVALCLEMSAMQSAGMIGKSWLLNRKQYPVSAQTHEDLYCHLSDLDWVGVFGLPSKAKFIISLNYDEVLQILKPLPDESGNLLRIPRGMQITVGGVDFMLDYPVDILQLKHGGFRLTYDTTEKSPIQTLTTNIIHHEVSSPMAGMKRLTFEIEMIQVKEIEVLEHVTANQNTNITKSFNDFYFYSRVFHGDGKNWKEMRTTHSPDIYDVTKPTAVLKLTEGIEDFTLGVTIPKVYNQETTDPTTLQVTSNMGSRIRTLIYTTLGAIDMNLDAYTIDQFKHEFYPAGANNRSHEPLGEYSSALNGLKTVVVFSKDYVNSGRDPLSFEELRERVINNTVGPNDIPVSHQAIADKAQDDSFKIIKAVDYVTNRAYWAIRPLPKPSTSDLITPAGASIETLVTTLSDLIGSGTVKNNGERLTITPDSIYDMRNGKMRILNKGEIQRILAMTPENRAKEVNSRELFYSPFHYVVDNEYDTIKLRPYYFDSPKANGKYYNDSNNKVGISLTFDHYSIRREEHGYTVRVEMKSNDVYKKFDDDKYWMQVLVHPYEDEGYVYCNARFIGRNEQLEPIFEFDIQTNFDVDDNNCLIVNNFSLYGSSELDIPIELNNQFEFIFGLYGDVPDWSRIELDNKIAKRLLQDDAKVLLSESVDFTLGYHLKWLWSRARTYADDITFARYEKDIPLLYEKDVYAEDAVTGSIINVVNGEIRYNIKHPKGSQVMDAKGQPVFRHRAGEVMVDENNRPIIKEPRRVLRRLEMMFIDGVYWFANDEIAQEYRNELVDLFIDWLVHDLEPLNEKTLEQTGIYFYPSATMGQIKVIYNEGIETYIEAAQSLQVNLTVSRQVYNNQDVLEKIKESSIRVLNEEIGKETVSVSSMVSKLVKEHGDDVIGLTVNNLGGNRNVITFSVLDSGKRATIRKKLNVSSDETLGVVEDVVFNFKVHSLEHEKNKQL